MKRVFLFGAVLGAAIIFLSSCHGRNNGATTAARIDSAKQEVIDSMNSLNNVKETKNMFGHPNAAPSPRHHYYSNTVQQSYPVSPSQAPVSRRKRWNWSTPAKGAVVGGAAGAAAGAIFDRKHRAAGAVIGGLIGAGAGTGAGVIIDNHKKKHPQY